MIVNTSSLVGESSAPTLAVYTGADTAGEVINAEYTVNQAEYTDVDASDVTLGAVGEAAPEVAGSATPFNEENFWQEIELIGRLSQLGIDRESLAHHVALAKSEWEKLKENTSDARETLNDLEADLKDKTDEFMRAAMELCSVARRGALNALPPKPVAESADNPTDQANPVAETKSDDGWRLHATKDLLVGLKGSKGKRDLIIKLAPTVGDLWDLRASASIEHMEFEEKLPKGCGKVIAQAIDETMSMFIVRYSLQQSNPSSVIQADELLAEILAAAKQNGWTKEDCQPKESDSPALRSGFAAFNEGRPHTDVLVDDAHVAKQWMIGWTGAQQLAASS